MAIRLSRICATRRLPRPATLYPSVMLSDVLTLIVSSWLESTESSSHGRRQSPQSSRDGDRKRQSTIATVWPSWTTSPSATRICVTVPAVGEVIGISIFIDSRIISVSSSSTACPTSTTIFQRLPTSSAFTSVTLPSSYRWHAVLAPRAPLPFGCRTFQCVDDDPPRLRRIDDVIDHCP